MLELLHECQTIFSEEPPVYAKPKAPPTTSASPVASTSNLQNPSRSASSMHSDLSERTPPEIPRHSQSDQPPVKPPKPGQSTDNIQSFHAQIGSFSQTNPMSPRMTTHSNFVMEPQSNNGVPRVSSPTSYTHPARPPSLHGPEIASQRLRTASSTTHTNDQRSEFTAPPKPPNPELLQLHGLLHAKLHSRLNRIRSASKESSAQLRLLGDDLDRGQEAVHDEMARLGAVHDVCRATGDEFQKSVEQAQKLCADLHAREDPDVDGLICATSLVGNQ